MCPVSIDQIMPFVERMVKVGDLENVGVLGILFSGSDWFTLGSVVLSRCKTVLFMLNSTVYFLKMC